MVGLGVALIVLLVVVKLIAAVFGIAFEVTEDIFKLALVLIGLGILVDVLTRFRAYDRFRR